LLLLYFFVLGSIQCQQLATHVNYVLGSIQRQQLATHVNYVLGSIQRQQLVIQVHYADYAENRSIKKSLKYIRNNISANFTT
jgi:hypothetical protein